MPFSEAQVKLLSSKLNENVVKTRQERGKTLSYIEGWHAIAEANRVFGFEGWDRETVVAECIWQDVKREPKACAYAARVRIRVRTGDTVVCREGSGVGHGMGAPLGQAHESALKEAETDATKRALATFGNLFGLALYDKEQNGVRRRRAGSTAVGISWAVLSGTGALLSRHDAPESYCSALRELLERTQVETT
jgi:DNA recombination protein Rad52